MIDKVKLALRIGHSLLDSEILDNIDAARAELIRSGVSENVANDDSNALIVNAVKTYCLMRMADTIPQAEGYQKAWESQLENIRKSTF